MSTFLTAEIGINHNGDAELACDMIITAANAGADAVKLQVGDPALYVAPHQQGVMRSTPWGVIPYVDYRRRLELSDAQLAQLAECARGAGVELYASALDVSAVPRLRAAGFSTVKVASQMATDGALLDAVRGAGFDRVILSTGGCTLEQIDAAVERLRPDVLMHCVSAYPTPVDLINLRMIEALAMRYRLPVGYSGHEEGIATTVAAVALGASYVERHLTLDRRMWGSDQSFSLEPDDFAAMARDIRTIEQAIGDGCKRVHPLEAESYAKFRGEAA